MSKFHHNLFFGTVTAVFIAIVSGVAGAEPVGNADSASFYHFKVGDAKVTALTDGVFELDLGRALLSLDPEELEDLLRDSQSPRLMPISVNVYLIETEGRLILVDAGAAKAFGPTLGKLPASLAAAGIKPEDIDAVLLTHMHPDHVGGLVDNGRPVFANASVYVDAREAEFWLSESHETTEGLPDKSFFAAARDALRPYQQAGRVQMFTAPTELMRGLVAMQAPGHTQGHTVYVFSSDGKEIAFWGDLTEIASIQFARPDVTIVYDGDAKQTAQQRILFYEVAVSRQQLVAGTHLPFPGVGSVKRERLRYEWLRHSPGKHAE